MKYDSSRSALLHPENRPPLLSERHQWPDDALCAELSRLAYIRFENGGSGKNLLDAALASAGLSRSQTFSDSKTGTQAFVTIRVNDATGFIVFRGTQTDDPSDIGTDADIQLSDGSTGGKVHTGFSHAFNAVWPGVHAWLTKSETSALLITGHSLGAALATLAASSLSSDERRRARLVTFGAPRVGDASFCAHLNGLPVTRYVDCCDLVTLLPPSILGYDHVHGLAYIDRFGILREKSTEEEMREDQKAARLDYLMSQSWRTGNVAIRDLADHAPINYVSGVLGERTED